MKRLRGLSLGLILVGLAGCGGDDDFGDLDAYMNEVRLRPPGEIEPMPAFGSYPTFTYNAAPLRSPFQPAVRVDLAGRLAGSPAVKPDPNRSKQYLEGFSIEQFEMVGTLSNASGFFALLRGAGGVHRLKVGDYLGRNDGRIVAISDSQVEVVEIVPDGAGAWLERPRTIPLKEHS
ncbi:pilus assembly protein PilP [Pseudomonas chlororaphis]|uniref:Type IV fimbriae biogenesis protein n=1 Tax=Pseudomonas chlororaphis TaxID=587753 RepID=A0AAX3FYH5_9PSED|nr:pilus assembly protein PilP [Pseudomonas chlororaphis]AZC34871.1 Type IV pilus biogenesis protein PilP [Pseudomonas chlororaphis subsp. piscium]AZC41410.1 Type IV pilus biogenesis protein PilP [Pseudomonas chlororaphis subsp. piscium]WDG73400.1 pilus assembly protein PilP [Pseudomonas chlororaphis]WDH28963.1 pilus assembly protein PilP [Pseudomonas chlororaphis]WDH71922.1 pilus assembly protein PilP [Pseudomonas chlororaphis]